MFETGSWVFTAWAWGSGLVWASWALEWLWNAEKTPFLKDAPDVSSREEPRVSLLFAARDEEQDVEAAVRSFLQSTHSNLEIIAVNDRSSDQTGTILNNLAEEDSRVRVLHIESLPEGWLGKTWALHSAAQVAKGKWLLFTDADVLFQPKTVSNALDWAHERKLDHIVVFPDLGPRGFWEEVYLSTFLIVSTGAVRPWRIGNANQPDAMGIGAFNFVKRVAYERMGTHEQLKLSIVDDVELGQKLKKSGARADAFLGHGSVRVDWHRGFKQLWTGLQKNFFAAFHFNLPVALIAVTGLNLLAWGPWLGLLGGVGGFAGGVLGLVGQWIVHQKSRRFQPASPLGALFVPMGMTLFSLALMNSVWKTLRRGGVAWRDTFYPLKDVARHKRKGWLALFGRY